VHIITGIFINFSILRIIVRFPVRISSKTRLYF